MIEKILLEERPWGDFERFCHNEEVTVKIITVNPHSRLSLQYHNDRTEVWNVVAGAGQLTIGENVYDTELGKSYLIEPKVKHRISTQDSTLKILEVAYGNFDENDIVRLQDDYGR